MTITYDELVTLVNDTIQSEDDTTFADHIDDFIQQAEDLIIKNCQIPATQTRITGNMTAGVDAITLPSDYIAMAYCSINSQYVKYKDSSFLSAAYQSATQGAPKFYADDHDAGTYKIRVRPIPDSTYAYVFAYYARPTSLTDGAGSGTTWISTNMESALVYGTLMQAALYISENELAVVYEQKFKEAMGLTKIEQEGKARDDRRRKDYIRPKVQEG